MSQEVNDPAVLAVLKELEPKILGQELPGWSCSCGAHRHGPTKAIGFYYPDNREYPDQYKFWYSWSVKMSAHPEKPGFDYTIGLTAFLPVDEVRALFAKHFVERSENSPAIVAFLRSLPE